MTEFKDHFSAQSDTYAEFRPNYPPAMFRFLASQCAQAKFCWDVATGNGQAALSLVEHFTHVYATDASANQLSQAAPHLRIRYAVEPAEKTALGDHSCDLVTVAQAIHWFRHEDFYAEVRRVLKPGGLIAVWGYGLHTVDAAVDSIVKKYYSEIVGPHWPPERKYIEERYETLPFPFKALTAPPFEITAEYTPGEMLGYLASWSATQRYIKQHEKNPLELIKSDLKTAWGAAEKRTLRWPIYLKVGHV
jgi:SAM-dependent methyltransferase